ncbi:MAG: cell division protein SepF [Candidatus Aenigmatarchaeota archaeon]
MMRRIFGKFKSEPVAEEYVQLDTEEPKEKKVVNIQIDKLMDASDADRILKKVRDGNIVFVKIKEMKDKDVGELKRSIEKIKRTCVATNGDIAGVGEDYLIITPSFAKVLRENVAE